MKTKNCITCNKAFEFESDGDPVFIGTVWERFEPRNCVQCSLAIEGERLKEEIETNRKAEQKKRDARWLELCPIRFRDTDSTRLPETLTHALGQWNPGERTNLALIGQSGTCKTRAGFLALYEAHSQGAWCEAISHSKLAELARDSAYGDNAEKARKRLSALERCDVLFIDDIGKPPSTERADAEFESVIDTRYANGSPTIWTANGKGAWLSARFGPDRGEPIVRRLAEDALIVSL